MASRLDLTDRDALLRHRLRASRGNGRGMFLHQLVADEFDERLSEVNRTFRHPAIVTGFSEFWQSRHPKARVVEDADTLTLEPGAHDLVFHVLSLHWANDPVGQLIQCRRALAPDGLMIAVTFGGQTLHELRAVLAEAETAVTGGLSPRVAPMGEIRDLGALLQRAGLALPVADNQIVPATYASAFDLMAELRAMGETNALAARDRRVPMRALFPMAADRYAQAFAAETGRVRATFELIWLTGWAPASTQPKPLRPGSATSRLADALGVPERQTGDKPPRRD